METQNKKSIRKFIQQTSIAGAGLIVASPLQIFAQTENKHTMSNNIKSKGYAARDASGKLSYWECERQNGLLLQYWLSNHLV